LEILKANPAMPVCQMKAEGKFPSVIFFRFQCGDAFLCFHTLIGSGANLSVNFSLRLCVLVADFKTHQNVNNFFSTCAWLVVKSHQSVRNRVFHMAGPKNSKI